MKRKSLLFALLLALFMPWVANAQETLTVYGDGTQTTNAYVPMYGGYSMTSPRVSSSYPLKNWKI